MVPAAPEVLDASALVALPWDEPGADVVETLLGEAVLSAVTWCEVLQRYAADGVSPHGKRESVEALGIAIEPFTAQDGEQAASLWTTTRHLGLSLGDRACLALGRRLHTAVHTADRAWADLDAGVEIRLVR